jgi:hypothetical protein
VNPKKYWIVGSLTIVTNKKIDYSNEDHCGPCGKNVSKIKNN